MTPDQIDQLVSLIGEVTGEDLSPADVAALRVELATQEFQSVYNIVLDRAIRRQLPESPRVWVKTPPRPQDERPSPQGVRP